MGERHVILLGKYTSGESLRRFLVLCAMLELIAVIAEPKSMQVLIREEIQDDDVFRNAMDSYGARQRLEGLVEDWMNDLGVSVSATDVREVADAFHVEHRWEKYFRPYGGEIVTMVGAASQVEPMKSMIYSIGGTEFPD